MKKYPRLLTMALVVSMIAALPASALDIPSASDSSNLSLLIPINRLELTEDQMVGLHEILSSLLEMRDDMESAVAVFEQTMIDFGGTSEELDELLADFREERKVQAEAIRESIATSLDRVGDLLSINQGLVLREELPGLLGLGRAHTQAMSSGMGQRMMMGLPGSAGMIVRRGQQMSNTADGSSGMVCEQAGLQASDQNSYWHEMASSTMPGEPEVVVMMRGMQAVRLPDMASNTMEHRVGRESMLHGMQQGSRSSLASAMMQSRSEREMMLQTLQGESSNGLPEMMQQRLGQVSDDQQSGVMRERMQSRLEQFGEQMPDELRERLGDAMSGLAERGAEQRMGEHLMIGDGSRMMMSGQFTVGTHQSDHGQLFDLIERIVDVLELKLDALE